MKYFKYLAVGLFLSGIFGTQTHPTQEQIDDILSQAMHRVWLEAMRANTAVNAVMPQMREELLENFSKNRLNERGKPVSLNFEYNSGNNPNFLSVNQIKKILLPGDTIFLYGQIGVGKTTFARLLINNYENEKKLKKSEVLSPTFNIMFEYDIKDFTIEHYDLHRLKNEKEIINIGLFANLEQNITIVEWPELIKKKPINRIDLFFEYSKDMNERTLTIKTSGRLKVNEF